MTRFALLASLLLTLTAAAPPKPAAPLPDAVQVEITTDLGAMTIELDAKRAPITSRNFLRYVDQRRYDGTTFYRVMRLPWGEQPNGLIQAGPSGDPRKVLPPIAHEPTSQTGILHKAGTLSLARFAPGTATADFSILLADMPSLDADPTATDADKRAGFAAFGQVVSGMDVVRRIYDVPLSLTKGEGVMRGQMIDQPVRILRMRRAPVAAVQAQAATK